MRRRLYLQLGEFARAALEEHAARAGRGLGPLFRDAVRHYLSNGSDRAAWRVPHFRRGELSPAVAAAVAVELSEADRRMLEERARLEHASAAQLLEHAALCYLADVAAGRVGRPITLRTRP